MSEATWKYVRLGDIAKTSSGGTPSRGKPAFYNGTIPFVKSGELGDRVVYETEEAITKEALASSSAKLFPKGTLCIALYGATVGKLGILGMDAATNQAVCGIFPPDELDTKFLYRFFESKRRELIEQGKGGAQSNISQGIIRDTVIPLPSLKEQHDIVAEIEKQFTRLEAGVAALKRVQANLKRYRAGVLKAACEGKLVPTEAELARAEGRKYETGAQLLERILTERRKNWQGRGKYKEPTAVENLTELPNGWLWATIDQLGELGTGATPKRGTASYYEGGKIPWVTIAALNKEYVDEAYEFVTERALAETNLTIFPPGTLLVAMYGEGKTRGKCAELRISATTNQAIAGIICSADIRSYLKLCIWRQYEELRLTASGGVQPNLNLSLVRAINIPLPPLAEQKRIVEEVERRLSVLEEMETAVQANLLRAARLRQAVLQRAFRGG